MQEHTREQTARDEDLAQAYPAHVEAMMRRLDDALGTAGLETLYVFAGAEQFAPRDDQPYSFRVEPYFNAWLPLTDTPGSVLKLVPGRRPELILLQEEDFWRVPPADPQGFWTERVAVRVARSRDEVGRCLGDPGPRSAAIGDAGAAAERFASANDAALIRRLDFFRAFKTPYEIACIERASASAARGHLAVAQGFRSGESELELRLRFCEGAQRRESSLPYDAVIAIGAHAAILHYQHSSPEKPMRDTSLLIDAGTSCLGYASDITRTHVRGAAEFQALRDSLEALQQTLCRELGPGVDFVALHARAHELLAGVLADHRLVRCSAAEALEHGLTRIFLPHGLGHLLGLQVHDAGGRQISPDGEERPPPPEHPFLRLTRRVEPGFVLTIEPGIYLIPALLRSMAPGSRKRIDWATVERLLPFGGIRIEDDVLIEPAGIRNLTREAFASLRVVE